MQPSREECEGYVRNIVATWREATPDQQTRGRFWYRAAHDFACSIAGGDFRSGAGVLAALSANKSWHQNCLLAERALQTGTAYAHVEDALRKVTRIIDGVDPTDVLPMDRKTGMFFRCIVDPADQEAVVIDRHAHDVAVGEIFGSRHRGLSSVRRYAVLARCYREAGRRLRELPSTVQAVTWVVHTDRGQKFSVH